MSDANTTMDLPDPVASTYLKRNAANDAYDQLTGEQVLDERFLSVIIDQIAQATGTAIGNMTANGGLAAAYDSVVSKTASLCALAGTSTRAWIGKTYSAPVVVERVTLWGSNNQGFISGINPTVTWNVWGKNGAAPTSPTDGTILLGSLTFADTADERGGRDIECNNGAAWEHVIVDCPSVNEGAKAVAQVTFYSRRPTGIFRKSAKVRSAQTPILVTDAVPSVGGQPFRFDGLSDDTAAWNQIADGINSFALYNLLMPRGTSIITQCIDPIGRSGWSLTGVNRRHTKILMAASAGSEGRFFQIGSLANAANTWSMKRFWLENLNAASLTGVGNPIDVRRASRGEISHVRCFNTNGAVTLGSLTEETDSQGLDLFNLDVQAYGPAGGALIDMQGSIGLRMAFSNFSNPGPSGNLNTRGLWFHPGPNNGSDSIKISNCEWNMTQNENGYGIHIDGTYKNIANVQVENCVIDRSDIANIFLEVRNQGSPTASISAGFNGIVSNTQGTGACIRSVNNGGYIRATIGGSQLSSVGQPVIRALGAQKSELSIVGNEFTNRSTTTPGASAILIGSGSGGLTIMGNEITIRTSQLPPHNLFTTFNYLVELQGEARDNIIVGNNASRALIADVNFTATGATGLLNPYSNQVANNQAPRRGSLKKRTTTTSSPTTLAQVPIPDGGVFNVECTINAKRTDAAGRGSWKMVGAFYRTGGGVQLIDSDILPLTAETWTVAFSAGTDHVSIQGTGATGHTVDWSVAKMEVTREAV